MVLGGLGHLLKALKEAGAGILNLRISFFYVVDEGIFQHAVLFGGVSDAKICEELVVKDDATVAIQHLIKLIVGEKVFLLAEKTHLRFRNYINVFELLQVLWEVSFHFEIKL